MRTTLRTVRVIICALFASGIASSQSKVRKSAPEPTAFYEDCGDGRSCVFDNPLPLPDSVLDALRETKEARSMQDELKGLNGEQFSHLFRAVKAHLVGPKETDYVVMGGFPMGGADAPWFWIVRFDQDHPRVIFFTFANGFELLSMRNNGYPNIRSRAFAGGTEYTNVYHYDGEQYLLVRRYQREAK
jgi:hypothetical protein